jgi:replication fork protection complex subunit Csm3/Swi3
VMATIDDIWDEPLPSPSKRNNTTEDDVDGNGSQDDAPYRSSKRPRSNLFLDSDSEREDGSGTKPPAGIDDLFKDLDSAPAEEFQITPTLDLDALRRAAEAEHANNTSRTPELLPNSSSLIKGAADNEEKGESKKRKTIPRLDEGRLLGPNGIPALMKEAKKFKIRGKGHEVSLVLFFS